MPAFWWSPPPKWLPILLSHIGSQVKRRQSRSYIFKEFAKISNLLILKQTLHVTHLLKLLDKMCNIKWIWRVLLKIQSGHDSVHRRTDGQTRWKLYTPFQRGGWGNQPWPHNAMWCQWTESALFQLMACDAYGAKIFLKPVLAYCNLPGGLGTNFTEIWIRMQ